MKDTINKLLLPFKIVATDVKKLEGYISTNYRVTDTSGHKYVLKYYTDHSELPVLMEEIDIINRIKDELDFELAYTYEVDGKYIHYYEDGSFARLLPFIEGKFFAEIDVSTELLHDFGRKMALLNKAMTGIEAPNIAARKLDWDYLYAMRNQPKGQHIEDPARRSLVNYYFDIFETTVLPQIVDMKHGIIHNDLNDWNVLVKEDKIVGVIDFGDVAHSAVIGELAIGLAYIMMKRETPIAIAQAVIKGYVEVLPLTAAEVKLLPNLIAIRLCESLTNSAEARSKATDTEYILISEKGGWALLEQWVKINPLLIERSFLEAAGLPIDDESAEKQKMSEVRDRSFSKALGLSYKEPIHMSSAAFQYMYDHDGNTYLDAYNNIPLVGHSHPNVSQAVSSQIRKLNTNTRYHNEMLYQYAEQLLTYFPQELDKVFFVNSGTEANDLAQRLANTYTNRNDQIVMDMGYHGHSSSLIDLSAYKYNGPGGKGRQSHVCELPLPKAYRGVYQSCAEYIADAKKKITALISEGVSFSSLLVEPISGCGGQVPLIDGYLKEMVPWLREQGIVTISDEVQIGFGRLGEWFWGFEMQEMMPDIVVLGKPMGNGFPIAGVVTTSAIADAFHNGMEYFSSFGGNPVSTAAGLAVLQTLEEEGLQYNAKMIGQYWKEQLQSLQQVHPIIGDVRGEGLFLGIEFTHPDGSPGADICSYVKNGLKENYILTGSDGKYEEVLKMKPSLCFSKENVDRFVSQMDKVLKKY